MACVQDIKKTNSAQKISRLLRKLGRLDYDDLTAEKGYVPYSVADKQVLEDIPVDILEQLQLLEELLLPSAGQGHSLNELVIFAKKYRGKLENLTYADLVGSLGYRHFTAEEKFKLECFECENPDESQYPHIESNSKHLYVVPGIVQEPTITANTTDVYVVPPVLLPGLFFDPSIVAKAGAYGVLTQMNSSTLKWTTDSASTVPRYMYCRLSLAPYGLLRRDLVIGETITLTGRIKVSSLIGYMDSVYLTLNKYTPSINNTWEEFNITVTVSANISAVAWIGFFAPPGESIEVQDFKIRPVN